jgi:hypothetical protein
VTALLRTMGLGCAALLLASAVHAQDGVPGVVQTIDGRTLTGRLVVGEDGRATVRGEAAQATLDVAELLSFERADAAAAPVATPHRVWLRSGLELPAVRIQGLPAAGGQPPRLAVELPAGGTVELPLTTLRALRHGGEGRAEPALFASDLQKPPANEDLLYVVKDGKSQRSLVTITSIGAETIDFLLRGDAYDFSLAGVTAVVFGANTGIAPDRQPKPRSVLELVTGERIEGRLLSLDAAAVRCRLDEGITVTVPATQLLRVQVASDRLAWLTELVPTVAQTPAFDRTWPWTVDRAIAGAGFIIAGKQFARGIGLVPRTRLGYDLGGRFDVFEATIGIDDRGGPEAHAVFRVFVDGKLAYESAPKTRGQAAEPVRVALGKAKAFAIEVDFGKNYDLGDHCAFADARLTRQ